MKRRLSWKALAEIYTMHSFAPFWNALLCTVLVGSVWVKKYTKINIEKMKSGSIFSLKIAEFFADFLQNFARNFAGFLLNVD